MIPSILVGLEALPRTASGKTDRRRLLEDYIARAATPAATGTCRPPRPACAKSGRRCSSTVTCRLTAVSSRSAAPRSRRSRPCIDCGRPSRSIATRLADEAHLPVSDGARAGRAHRSPGQRRGGGGTRRRAATSWCTLSRGSDAALPPLFLIASAGGTLGAYEKLARALKTGSRRDRRPRPVHLGRARCDPGFPPLDRPVHRRHPAAAAPTGRITSWRTRRREPLATRWHDACERTGRRSALLALVDPFGLDRPTSRSFGYRVMQARFRKAHFRTAVRIEGGLRAMLAGFARKNEPIRIRST